MSFCLSGFVQSWVLLTAVHSSEARITICETTHTEKESIMELFIPVWSNSPMPLIMSCLRVLVSEFRGDHGKCLRTHGDQGCGCPIKDEITQAFPTLRTPLRHIHACIKDGRSASVCVLRLLTNHWLLMQNPIEKADRDKLFLAITVNFHLSISFSKVGYPNLFCLFWLHALYFTFFPFLSSEFPLISFNLSWNCGFSDRTQCSSRTLLCICRRVTWCLSLLTLSWHCCVKLFHHPL